MACPKRTLCATVLLCAALPAFAAPWQESFDESVQLPAGWRGGITGDGAARWAVVADSSAPSPPNVLKQSGEATFCWAARVDQPIQNGFAEVKFKPLSGREDQAGGLVFRFQDQNNYYVVRANALEGNVVMYKTVKGKRSSLQVKGRLFGYGVDAEVPTARWSTLRVEFKDNLYTAYLDGKKLFDVQDDTFRTPGSVGVWTKADSVTLFDDFAYGNSMASARKPD